jgi:hypothetical protein
LSKLDEIIATFEKDRTTAKTAGKDGEAFGFGTAALLLRLEKKDIQKEFFILGMELALRIVRNRARAFEEQGIPLSEQPHQEAACCDACIRLVQVEIGSGRQSLPEFTSDEIEEVERIA